MLIKITASIKKGTFNILINDHYILSHINENEIVY